MKNPNPFLIQLAECKHEGHDPDQALVMLMMLQQMSQDTKSILMAVQWHLKHGEPTYESLERWAIEWWNDPANAAEAERLAKRHAEVMASFSPEEKAHLAAYAEE